MKTMAKEIRDSYIFDRITKEAERQNRNLELIASENYVSREVLEAIGSCCTNKYAEGYPGKRYYGGCEYIDEIESEAINRAKMIFNAEHANVQPHSGSQANMAAYAAILKPGDTILSASMNAGGHLTHSSPVSFVSQLYKVVTYDIGSDGLYDMDDIRRIAKECHPKLIIAGASAYPRLIDYHGFRGICDEVGAYLLVDMAHIAGLVAGGMIPSPVPYADIVTTTTHKTLRGPRGGMILCKKEFAKAVDKAIFPYSQGGGLQNIVAAKAVCLYEAAQPEFRKYAKNVIENAKTLENQLRIRGIDLVSDGTDNHLLLLDLRKTGKSGKEIEKLLDSVYITVNKNMIPNDPRKPNETSGIRIGTAAVTTRGMGECEMMTIAWMIAAAIKENTDPDFIRNRIKRLTSKFPVNGGE